MGNESSHEGVPECRRESEVQIRSCNTSRPIGAESLPSSPRLLVKGRLAPKNHAVNKIVVVAEGISEESDDQHLRCLENIHVCLPLIFISDNHVLKSQPNAKLYKLNHKILSDFSCRYQEHLRLCSEAVAADQHSLCSKIKEVEATVLNQYTSLIERRNRFAKYSEQIQKVNEILTALSRIHNALENTLSLAEQLNGALPEGEQLEKLSFH